MPWRPCLHRGIAIHPHRPGAPLQAAEAHYVGYKEAQRTPPMQADRFFPGGTVAERWEALEGVQVGPARRDAG